jgi:hypothetical protein
MNIGLPGNHSFARTNQSEEDQTPVPNQQLQPASTPPPHVRESRDIVGEFARKMKENVSLRIRPLYLARSAFQLNRKILAILFVSSTVALAQADKSGVKLNASTAFPIVFTNTVSAARSHAGDPVQAKTSQAVHLPSGAVIPAGTKISGHVVSANAFVYDDMPYVCQRQSALTIQFDLLQFVGNLCL